MMQLSLTAYVSTPTEYSTKETILLYVALAVFAVVFFLIVNRFRIKSQTKIGHIIHIFPDENPRYLHLISELSLMNRNGSFFRHVLFDLVEKKCYSGDGQKGNSFAFGSPFMQRSVTALTEKLHIRLRPLLPKDAASSDFDEWENEDDWEDQDVFDDNHDPEVESVEIEIEDYVEPPLTEIPVHKQSSNDHLLRSNKITETTYFLLTENEQNELSTLKYVRNGRSMGEHNLKLKYGNLNNLLILREGKWACFSYEKSTFTGSSQALCLLNLDTGVLEYDKLIRV